MPKTINLAGLTAPEWDELLSAVGHHEEVLETDAWDELEDELRATKSLLRLLSHRTAAPLTITDDEWEILDGAISHHEEVYSDAVMTEDDPEPWLTIYRTTLSLRTKIGG